MTDTAAADRASPTALRVSVIVAAFAVAACFGAAIALTGTPTQAVAAETATTDR